MDGAVVGLAVEGLAVVGNSVGIKVGEFIGG
jgi:hypothetical protein